MEKEGRAQERPQSWKCPSVGMGSKMEVVLTALHTSYRAGGWGEYREGSGSGAHAPMGGGRKLGSGVPTHLLKATEGEIIVQSGHKSNSTLSSKKVVATDSFSDPFLLHVAGAGAGAVKGPGWGFPQRFPGGRTAD